MTEKEFVEIWIGKIKNGLLKSFPEDFLDDIETEQLNLPGTDIILGEELFGNYEILDTRKNSVTMVDSLAKAKYLIYGNRDKPLSIRIPLNTDSTVKIVKKYESHIDQLLKEIENDFSQKFGKSKNSLTVINEIFHSLNLKRY